MSTNAELIEAAQKWASKGRAWSGGQAKDIWAGCDICERLATALAASDATLAAEQVHFRTAYSTLNDEVCQILAAALGYPRYCDDQKLFPGATEKDGVCAGEHVAQSIAAEAAQVLVAERAEVVRLREALEHCIQVLGWNLERATCDEAPTIEDALSDARQTLTPPADEQKKGT